MWSILLGIGIGVGLVVVFSIFCGVRDGWDSELFEGAVGGSFFLGFVGAFVGFIVAMSIGTGLPTEWQERSREDLVSMHSADGLHGSFFLGSGSIQSEPFYFYYKRTPFGLVRESRRCDDNVYVVEEDRTDGVLVTMANVCTKSSDWGFCTAQGTRTTFYVPRGSVVQQFELK